MPLPTSPFLRFRFNGPIAGDTYSFGFAVALSAPIDPSGTNLAAVAGDAQIRANGLWTDFLGLHNSSAVIRPLATVSYYQGGALAGTAEATGTTTPGTGTSPVNPAYVSACVTLRTGTLTRSGRGRFYLPITVFNVDQATLQLSATPLGDLATAVSTFLSSFNTGYVDETAEGRVAVLSTTQGAIREVVSASIDSIPDTQRGRKSKEIAASTVQVPLTVT